MDRNHTPGSAFCAEFTYTEAILSDFEALYRIKGTVSLPVRVVLGVLGAAGAIYFGFDLYTNGLGIARLGYLIVCSLMILVALSSRRRSGADGTLEKYRKYYLNRKVSFRIDENGVEMKLQGQKNFARSKFSQLYSLLETEKCFYFVIKGKAYYILSKEALSEEDADALRKYMEGRCKKKFQFFQL